MNKFILTASTLLLIAGVSGLNMNTVSAAGVELVIPTPGIVIQNQPDPCYNYYASGCPGYYPGVIFDGDGNDGWRGHDDFDGRHHEVGHRESFRNDREQHRDMERNRHTERK